MPEQEVVVVATVQVLPGHAEGLIEGFRPIVEGSHAEPGCLSYSLHRDKADPQRFVIVERWRSQEDLDAHFAQPHMAAIAELADSLAGPPEVVFSEPIPLGEPAKNFAGA
ncbi:MAG: antibiotic biosynthesis monooxygenase [Thermoleophilia bacterium]|nr:antibiotic biosynthesis monooxygenase [Thermoleophilia bacterium]